MQGPQRKLELQTRYARELEDLLAEKSLKQEENIPRQSGALEWRQSRGELGDTKATAQKLGTEACAVPSKSQP